MDQKLNEAIVSKILTKLGIEHYRSGQNFMARCPNPGHEDADPSWGINYNTGLHNCFGCGFRGDMETLLNIYGVSQGSFKELIDNDSLSSFSNLSLKEKLGDDRDRIKLVDLPVSFSCLSYDDVCSSLYIKYMESRLLSVEKLEGAIKKFELGYIQQGKFSGRVIFVGRRHYKGSEGKYQNPVWLYVGRAINESLKPKYLYPVHCNISAFLFNFDYCLCNFKDVIVVEGVFDLLRLWEIGVYNAVATMGCNASKDQVFLLEKFSNICIAYDNDEAGNKGAKKLIKNLVNVIKSGLSKVYRIHLDNKDVGEVSGREEWNSLFNKASWVVYRPFRGISLIK